MPRRKRAPATPEETSDWLKKAGHSAPRPHRPRFFPRILEQSVHEGFSREELLNTLDEWLNYGYCRIIDPIAQDIEITHEGERFFY